MTALVHYSVENGVARLTLDSPHNRNAMSTALVDQLRQGLTDAADDPGVRCGYTVVPHDLKFGGTELNGMWARRQATKFNGVSYITQRAAEAVYSDEGKKQIKEIIEYYRKNAKIIYNGLRDCGFTVYGAVDSPYVWLKTPDNMKSWDFFDLLLEKLQVVGTPGEGFGPAGEGYFRLTAFGTTENTEKAVARIKNYFAK